MSPTSRDLPAERLLAESAWVQSLARRLVVDAHLADDLSQEAFAAALARAPGARPVRELRPWLRGIVGKLRLLDRRRSLRRERRERLAAPNERTAPSPDQTLLRAERIQRVGGAVLELEEPYRSTVLMRFLDELSVAEVAARMGVAPSTVRVRTKRALEMLHERLLAEWSDDGGAYSLALLSISRPPSPALAATASTSVLFPGMKLKLQVLVALFSLVSFGGVWFALGANGPDPVEIGERAATSGSVRGVDVDASEDENGSTAIDATSAGRRSADPSRDAPVGDTAPADPPAFGETTLAGRVIDGEGGPVAGARVSLFPHPFHGARRVRSSGLAEPIDHVVSDSDGSFDFEGLAGFLEYGLRASADGFVDAYGRATAGDAAEIVLRAAVRLHGRVFESDGATPVAGAHVVSPAQVADRTCRTAADGSYELPSVEGGARIRLEVFPPGRIPAALELRLPVRGEVRHDVRLSPSAAFEGRVVDEETGRPVAGAGIYAGRAGRRVATADAGGRFRVDVEASMLARERNQEIWLEEQGDPLLGAYLATDLRAEAPGYTPTSAPLWVPRRGSGLEFTLPLSRAGRVVGRVTRPDGSPAVGAAVGWERRPTRFLAAGAQTLLGSGSRNVLTDGEGRFELPRVPWGPSFGGALEVRHGRGPAILVGDACPAKAGETRHLELVLEERPALRGRVLVNAVPEHAYVYVRRPGEERERQFETDPLGRFTCRGLAPGTYLVNACTGDGTAIFSADREIVVPLPEGELVEIHIDAAFDVVSGRVVGTSGQPMAGVRVRAFPQPREGVAVRAGLLSGGTASLADGTFRIRLEQDGRGRPRFTVSALHGGASYERIDVEAGRGDLEIVLPPVRWANLILVRDATGEPVTSARLSWLDPTSESTVTLGRGTELSATSEGLLRVQLPIGSIELEADAPSLGIGPARQAIGVDPDGPQPRIEVRL